MKILVLNSGSSSVKFQIIETDIERMNAHQDLTLAVGQVEKIGLSDSRLLLEVPDRKPYQDYREILEHRAAIEWVLRILVDPEEGIRESVEAVGGVGRPIRRAVTAALAQGRANWGSGTLGHGIEESTGLRGRGGFNRAVSA